MKATRDAMQNRIAEAIPSLRKRITESEIRPKLRAALFAFLRRVSDAMIEVRAVHEWMRADQRHGGRYVAVTCVAQLVLGFIAVFVDGVYDRRIARRRAIDRVRTSSNVDSDAGDAMRVVASVAIWGHLASVIAVRSRALPTPDAAMVQMPPCGCGCWLVPRRLFAGALPLLPRRWDATTAHWPGPWMLTTLTKVSSSS